MLTNSTVHSPQSQASAVRVCLQPMRRQHTWPNLSEKLTLSLAAGKQNTSQSMDCIRPRSTNQMAAFTQSGQEK